MADAALSGSEFKKQLRAGQPKMGLFLNAHSPTVAEQLAHSGYDWLLVDTQHGPMGYERLSAMLSGIANGGAKSLVRVGGYDDRPGIQQALDLGADGVLVPYINTAEEARQARDEPTRGDRGQQRDSQFAGFARPAECRKCATDVADRLVHLASESLTGGRELQSACAAHEQRGADLFFQQLDPMAHGTLCAVQFRRGRSEAQVPRGDCEYVQRIDRGQPRHVFSA